MDFQVSSPSNHFFFPCSCSEQYSVQLQKHNGCAVNWLHSPGEGRHRRQDGEHPRTWLGDGAGSHLMLLGCPMGTAGTWES